MSRSQAEEVALPATEQTKGIADEAGGEPLPEAEGEKEANVAKYHE